MHRAALALLISPSWPKCKYRQGVISPSPIFARTKKSSWSGLEARPRIGRSCPCTFWADHAAKLNLIYGSANNHYNWLMKHILLTSCHSFHLYKMLQKPMKINQVMHSHAIRVFTWTVMVPGWKANPLISNIFNWLSTSPLLKIIFPEVLDSVSGSSIEELDTSFPLGGACPKKFSVGPLVNI